MTKMIVHSGARRVSREELHGLTYPEATDTWTPVPHDVYDEMVLDALNRHGIGIVESEYALTPPDNDGYRHRMFFTHHTADLGSNGIGRFTVGGRNSSDKSVSVGMAYGFNVTICDNMAIIGEYVIKHKHSRYILNKLPELINVGAERYFVMKIDHERFVDRLQNIRLRDTVAKGFVFDSMMRGTIAPAKMKSVWAEYKEPTHPEHGNGTAWTLYNAFTEVAKCYKMESHAKRTLALTGQFSRQFTPDLFKPVEAN